MHLFKHDVFGICPFLFHTFQQPFNLDSQIKSWHDYHDSLAHASTAGGEAGTTATFTENPSATFVAVSIRVRDSKKETWLTPAELDAQSVIIASVADMVTSCAWNVLIKVRHVDGTLDD